MPWRSAVATALLAAEALWFAHEQMGATRYFCWAPLHEHVFYRVDARAGERALSDAEVAQRYGRRGAFFDAGRREFWELNAAAHVIDSIRWREAAAPRAEPLHVTLHYRIDDGEPQQWTYTP